MARLLSKASRRYRRSITNAALWVLLLAVGLLAPVVTFAGVSVIWPSSTQTVNVNTSPPITFASGADYTQATALGFTSSFSATNSASSYTMTLSGLSGGTLTVDKLLTITATDDVSTYKMQVATAYSGTLTPTTLKVRLWTGATAPTADGDAAVCAVLDLMAALNTESTASCAGNGAAFVQAIVVLPTGQTTQSGTVSIRPSSIAFV